MAINLKSERTDRLARELCAVTGESLTEAVTVAIEERLARERVRRLRPRHLDAIVAEFHALPVLDARSADEIIGYDESGLSV
jgi:antitoxin VapB